MKISYNQAKNIINEGDVLLFRSSGCMFDVGYWISLYTDSKYSHCGLAHWEKDVLHCLEFREFVGSRNEPIINQLTNNREIDVYRVHKSIVRPKLVFNPRLNLHLVGQETLEFTPEIAAKITSFACSLIGKPYGWRIIVRIALTYIPLLRLLVTKNNNNGNTNQYVCSTLLARAYRLYFADLVPFVDDEFCTPGDIASSYALTYLFTLTQ